MSSPSEKRIKKNKPSSSALSDDVPKVTQAMIDAARFRVGLKDVPRKQRVNWKEENREAVEEYNRRVEAHGVFSDGLRQF
jgi:antitoxin CcdA